MFTVFVVVVELSGYVVQMQLVWKAQDELGLVVECGLYCSDGCLVAVHVD